MPGEPHPAKLAGRRLRGAGDRPGGTGKYGRPTQGIRRCEGRQGEGRVSREALHWQQAAICRTWSILTADMKAAALIKRELTVYRRLSKDPRCPRRVRWLLGAAVLYTVSPIDLIPDFIPVLGHLDDLLLVPLLVWLALRSLPPGLLQEVRSQVQSERGTAAEIALVVERVE
jgi:uncharacterized membrane protein YkvA (DUF1232 family)